MSMRTTPSEENTATAELLVQLQSHNTALQLELKRTQLERDHYKFQLSARIRALYAARSEARAHPQQTDLFFNEAEAQASTPLTVSAKQTTPYPRIHLPASVGLLSIRRTGHAQTHCRRVATII